MMTLEEYQRLESEGRLIVLPCAIGGKVYTVDYSHKGYQVKENVCEAFEYSGGTLTLADAGDFGYEGIERFCSFAGHYLTQEEAQEALDKYVPEKGGFSFSDFYTEELLKGIEPFALAEFRKPLPQSGGKPVRFGRGEE